MIDVRHKPNWLPQVSAPFIYTLNKLKADNVGCKYVEIDPNELSPSQAIVFLDQIKSDKSEIKPIYISNDMRVLDGHHRLSYALSNEIPIKAIMIDLPQMDAVRALNKVQDLYEYENMQEVVAQDQINYMNRIDSGPNRVDFIESLNKVMQEELNKQKKPNTVGGKKKKITGYRNKGINKKSVIGNYFLLKPVDGYLKYEMEYDNLLDTDDIGLVFHKGNSPVFMLAKTWFPNLDFDKLSKKLECPKDVLLNRAIVQRAMDLGYDGIKYGDIMIQGLNK